MNFQPGNSISSTSFIIFSVIFFLNDGCAMILPKYETGQVPAVFVFGDSIVDTGNNNHINTLIKCNFPPYGKDFQGGIPTGRFSNGRVPSDFIAEELGLKELLPAYLDSNLQLQDLLSGSALSLSDQLEMFKNYIKKIKAVAGEDRVASILSKGIYMLSIGTDDMANTYFVRMFQYDINSYTDLMLNSSLSFLQELYALGARRIGVLSIPAIGCLPVQRTLRGGLQRSCSVSLNQAAILFNSKLSSQLDNLNKKLPAAKLVYMDMYYRLLNLIQHPTEHGFEVVDNGCCGTGDFEAGFLFCAYNPNTCKDDTKYIFWDSYHPTEQAYALLTSQMIENTFHKFF
ncbi:hypothetical protein ACB092_02G240100 [Castanea dentata]